MDGWKQMNLDDFPSHIILSKISLDNTCYFFSSVGLDCIFPRKDQPSLGLYVVHEM